VELYSSLMDDLKAEQVSAENIVEKVRQIGYNSTQKYRELLQKKQQAIHDFGVLMGLVDDSSRFEELKGNMHKNIANYFDMVTSMHKGGKLGISWPLPLKKFSAPIRDGLYRDTILHTIQNAVGKDFGFILPEKDTYGQMLRQIKETMKVMSSKGNSFEQRWRAAKVLPATIFFLSGIDAYAEEASDGLKGKTKGDYLEAGLTAATTAYTIADDLDEFVTTWVLAFTTLNGCV
jgi:hypothetical protein